MAKALANLGVPEPAANTYGCMLATGAMKPSLIAAALGVSRDEAYRRLAYLVAQGFASATLTGPIMFVPAEPKEVLEILYRGTKRQEDLVVEERERLEPLLRKLCTPSPLEGNGTSIKVISGRRRAYDRLHEMLSGATKEMLVLNSHPAAAQLATEAGLWDRAQQRAALGLQIRILMDSSPTTLQHAGRVTESNCQVRVTNFDRAMRFSIADQKAMLFFACIDASPWMDANDSVISTKATAFLQMERALFWRLWDEAEPLDAG